MELEVVTGKRYPRDFQTTGYYLFLKMWVEKNLIVELFVSLLFQDCNYTIVPLEYVRYLTILKKENKNTYFPIKITIMKGKQLHKIKVIC